MNEEQEALNTVAGWGSRQMIAAVIVAPFILERHKDRSLSDQQKRVLMREDIINALRVADFIVALSAENKP